MGYHELTDKIALERSWSSGKSEVKDNIDLIIREYLKEKYTFIENQWNKITRSDPRKKYFQKDVEHILDLEPPPKDEASTWWYCHKCEYESSIPHGWTTAYQYCPICGTPRPQEKSLIKKVDEAMCRAVAKHCSVAPWEVLTPSGQKDWERIADEAIRVIKEETALEGDKGEAKKEA